MSTVYGDPIGVRKLRLLNSLRSKLLLGYDGYHDLLLLYLMSEDLTFGCRVLLR